ncbi:Asp23/Gls24 family envelope stress response protein [Laceyella sacchari]|nr:Asp23/Gls24 family envelope stress response protein [Laceyella sacchari]
MVESNGGSIRITDGVVAVIAGLAAAQTQGISSMSSGMTEGIKKRVSGKGNMRGVQVVVQDTQASIDLRVIVQYGCRINEVCHRLQQDVKQAVENMTGLEVTRVNVRVDGVDWTREKRGSQTEK